MMMRITWGKLYPNTWDECERAYKETLAGKETQGLRGRWLARDVNDPDGGFAVSVWETIDDLQAYEHSAVYREMYAPRLRPFFSGEYTTYRCEVKYPQEQTAPRIAPGRGSKIATATQGTVAPS